MKIIYCMGVYISIGMFMLLASLNSVYFLAILMLGTLVLEFRVNDVSFGR